MSLILVKKATEIVTVCVWRFQTHLKTLVELRSSELSSSHCNHSNADIGLIADDIQSFAVLAPAGRPPPPPTRKIAP